MPTFATRSIPRRSRFSRARSARRSTSPAPHAAVQDPVVVVVVVFVVLFLLAVRARVARRRWRWRRTQVQVLGADNALPVQIRALTAKLILPVAVARAGQQRVRGRRRAPV